MEMLYEKARKAICEWSQISLYKCIGKGLDVNETSEDGTTLLMEAAQMGNPEIIDILLKAGANVNARNKAGNTALMYTSNLINIKYLVECGADFNIKNDNGDDAVSKAFCENQKSVFDFYVEKGAKPDITIEEYATIVSKRSEKASDFLIFLYQKGFDVGSLSSKLPPWPTLLETAVMENTYSSVDVLLRNGVDPNATDVEGRTPLHYVMLYNASALIAYDLVKHGADVNAVDAIKNTPLHYINSIDVRNADLRIKQDRVRILNLLLENGAKIWQENSIGSMVVHSIFNSGNDDYIRTALSVIVS